MPLRQLLRISVPETDVEDIARSVATRQGADYGGHDVLEANNWLSIPITVNENWFAKIVAPQHLHVHTMLTHIRNVTTASSSAVDNPHTRLFQHPMFQTHDDVLDMARQDRDALRQIRQLGVRAPEPLDVFTHDRYAVLVLQYLPNHTPLADLPREEIQDLASDLFRLLKYMHDAGIAHGDLHTENILLAPTDGGEEALHVIDATRVNPRAINDARAYDIACALASLAPLIGAEEAVAAARAEHAERHINDCLPFLNYLKLRPQTFDAGSVQDALTD